MRYALISNMSVGQAKHGHELFKMSISGNALEAVKYNDPNIFSNSNFLKSVGMTGTPNLEQFLRKWKISEVVTTRRTIVTLGHVDNGKTTTTMVWSGKEFKDIDSTAEEQERGVTINSTTHNYVRWFIVPKDELPENLKKRIVSYDTYLSQEQERVSKMKGEEKKSRQDVVMNNIMYETNRVLVKGAGAFHNQFPIINEDTPLDLSEAGYVAVHAEFFQNDAPGHADYMNNAVSSTATVDVAMVVLDANNIEDIKSDQAQTLEHLRMAGSFGKPVHIIMNKMDMNPSMGESFSDKSLNLKELAGPSNYKDASVVDGVDLEMDDCESDFGEEVNLMTREEIINIVEEAGGKVIGFSYCSALGASEDKDLYRRAIYTSSSKYLALYKMWKSLLALNATDTTNDEFLLAAENTFDITGHGTAISGSVMQGTLSVGDTVSVHTKAGHVNGTVGSIQQFYVDYQKAYAGDNIAFVIKLPNKDDKAFLKSKKNQGMKVVVRKDTSLKMAAKFAVTVKMFEKSSLSGEGSITMQKGHQVFVYLDGYRGGVSMTVSEILSDVKGGIIPQDGKEYKMVLHAQQGLVIPESFLNTKRIIIRNGRSAIIGNGLINSVDHTAKPFDPQTNS